MQEEADVLEAIQILTRAVDAYRGAAEASLEWQGGKEVVLRINGGHDAEGARDVAKRIANGPR